MKSQTTRSPLLVSAVLLASLAPYCARAQPTPGAIPDSGTCQGSTQLQQEQDR
jgi:hypothetical protein